MENHEIREKSIDELREICNNDGCKNSIDVLISALTGDTDKLGCDLLANVYDSSRDDHYIGSRVELIQASGYLINLIGMGIEVQATYRSLKGNRDVWENVHDQYVKKDETDEEKSVDKSIKKILEYN